MHRLRGCAVGALVLLAALGAIGCGDDDDGDVEASAFCAARIDLEDRVTELEGFQLTSEEDAPEARERLVAVIDALRTMLDAAPEDIRIEADTMAEGLDDIEARIEEADADALSTETPGLLAQIGGAGSGERADAVAEVNAFAARQCG